MNNTEESLGWSEVGWLAIGLIAVGLGLFCGVAALVCEGRESWLAAGFWALGFVVCGSVLRKANEHNPHRNVR